MCNKTPVDPKKPRVLHEFEFHGTNYRIVNYEEKVIVYKEVLDIFGYSSWSYLNVLAPNFAADFVIQIFESMKDAK